MKSAFLGLTLAAVASLLLSGCGSTPVHTSSGKPGTASNTSRGGGYYQDDGPGDTPPADIASIPDAVPKEEPLHRFANRPYSVLGESYVPDTSKSAYRASGIASWYGRKFHGKKTASGEPYDMYGMTAAHRTLPIPSFVRVTNPANGKSVVVRVNDRGPFHRNRLIDLSYSAAYKLGYISKGSTEVIVERVVPGEDVAPTGDNTATLAAAEPVLQPATSLAAVPQNEPAPAAATSGNPPPAAASGRIMLQLGAFGLADAADRLRQRLQTSLTELSEPVLVIAHNGLHKVRIGPYSDRQSAEQMAERIRATLSLSPLIVTQ